MVDDKQIKEWLKKRVITKEQAAKMLGDASRYKEEKVSNNLIVTVSTVGAILLGIGAILFIASNWQQIPNPVKVMLLVGSTVLAYYLGYVFRYQKQNLPKVGASLIFLGALLFGATIFLIAQMYHINANSHVLVLVWLIGVLPLVYVFQSIPIAALSAILFYLWIGLFVFRTMEFQRTFDDFLMLPALYLVSGILLFGIGAVHYFSKELKDIARVYRIAGIKVVMVSLFLLTFKMFSGHMEFFDMRNNVQISSQLTVGFVLFSIVAIILLAIDLFYLQEKILTAVFEAIISFVLLAVVLLFFFFPSTSNVYVVIFNLILAGVIAALLFVGYHKEDMALVNTGMAWLAIFIVVKYFDFFWGLLDRSVFFMVGGLILVLGGIALERKRRQIKTQFTG